VVLPTMSRLELTLRLRRQGVQTPILMLTAREFALLEYLMRHGGHILSRSQIVGAVWPRDFEGGTTVVDTYVHHLREKVDRPPARPLIRTVRGAGYALGR
jgi:DNA-binding response OmpR family regulator